MQSSSLLKGEEAQVMQSSSQGDCLIGVVFSWSIQDVLNRDLYKDKVKKIPKEFLSTSHYVNSFVFPLIEETHADLFSSLTMVSKASTVEILEISIPEGHNPPHDLLYNIKMQKLGDSENNREVYEPETGDLIALTDIRPTCIVDLNRLKGSYLIALVQKARKNTRDESFDEVQILSSKPIEFEQNMQKNKKRTIHFAVFLINMTTNLRIWKALKSGLGDKDMNIIKKVLQADSTVGENCTVCFPREKYSIDVSSLGAVIRSFSLNNSQEEAVVNCIAARECYHKTIVKLIWGPPGTGKTKTVGSLLFALLKRNCRTLTCAPTNVAVLEVTTRFLRLVMDSFEYNTYGLGDIVLFGNGERMKIDDRDDLLDVFLDYRAHILSECFAPLSGWRHCLQSMICLLEDPEQLYRDYLKIQEKDDEIDDHDYIEVQGEGLLGDGNLKSNKRKEDINAQDLKNPNQSIWRRIITQTLKENKSKKKWKEKVQCHMDNQPKYVKTEKGFPSEDGEIKKLTFLDFIKQKYNFLRKKMVTFIVNMYTHLPTCFISLQVVRKMIKLLGWLECLATMLRSVSVSDLKEALSASGDKGNTVSGYTGNFKLCMTIRECLQILLSLRDTFSLPDFFHEYAIKCFCLRNARMLFCTASSSAKLHEEAIDRLEMLVIDEAAQLKECESIIPLQLPGLHHIVLIGDECQLPAMVRSKISEKAGFGRSLFERLVLLGHQKCLLNVQYRMHPSISLFPNKEFYNNQILDSPIVKERSYEKCFLQGNMYGAYSFMNVAYGQDDFDDGHSRKNMVEVAVIAKMVANLFKESVAKKQRVSVGVISPYKAQVFAIQEKLEKTYSMAAKSDFSVSIRSIDGFQGGEEDVIIISTVRSNEIGSVGFLSNPQRTNVALTRARYCLWIVGNEVTLVNSDSVWERLVIDAKARGCFHNADEDESLAEAITASLVELDQVGNLLNMDSLLFRKAKWKVFFDDAFLKSLARIKSTEVRKEILSLLMQLSSGRRQPCREINLNVRNDTCQLLELYKVNVLLYLVWTVDIVEENLKYIQALKIWDVVPFSEIPKLEKSIDIFYGEYSMDVMNCCKFRHFDGNFQVPVSWSVDRNVPRKSNPLKADHMQLLVDQLALLTLKDE